jgi:hypothetical protein
MNYKRHIQTMIVLMVATSALLMTACNFGRPVINGGKTGQPIMDGWTFQMAGEYWLPSVMGELNPQTPEEFASLNKVNVQVKLPVFESNPMPKDGVIYRQASTGGFVTFHLTEVEGDTLNPVGTAEMWLREEGYFENDTTEVRVLSRGKGIFTVYHIERQRQRGEPVRYEEFVRTDPAIISVYPDGDSLLICRGNFMGDAYVAE